MMMTNDVTPTPERFECGDLILVGKVWQKRYQTHLNDLAERGELGGWEERLFRLFCAHMLASDWAASEYNRRITTDFSRVCSSNRGGDGADVNVISKRDRYDYVMRSIGGFAKIVRFFVIEDGNAAIWLRNKGMMRPAHRHYKRVWAELCRGLDELSKAYKSFHDKHGSLIGG